MPHEVNANKLARTINILGDAKRGLDAHPPLGEDALKAFKVMMLGRGGGRPLKCSAIAPRMGGGHLVQ